MLKLNGRNIPKTEQFLQTQNIEIDKYDGVLSFIGGNSTSDVGPVTLTYRDVLTSLETYHGTVCFGFRTTKDSTFPKKSHLEILNQDEWFTFIESAARILATELGLSEITIMSGLKDRKFLQDLGYTQNSHFMYTKDID